MKKIINTIYIIIGIIIVFFSTAIAEKIKPLIIFMIYGHQTSMVISDVDVLLRDITISVKIVGLMFFLLGVILEVTYASKGKTVD